MNYKYKIDDKVVLYDWDECGELFDMDVNRGVFIINKYFGWSPDCCAELEYLDESEIVMQKSVTICDRDMYDGKYPYYSIKENGFSIPEDLIKEKYIYEI